MTKMTSLRPTLLFPLICILIINHAYSKNHCNDRKKHIVYMGDVSEAMDPTALTSLHADMAQKVLGSDFTPEAVLHSYKKSFNGFVINLTEEEAETMAEMDNVVSVFLSKTHYLQTTRSWDFIGFPQLVKRTSIESDIIVGVLDSGIWPNSESFNGEGFGPPPSKWKGSCQNFTCNNKIIGAKYFNKQKNYTGDTTSPIDIDGHGTHCASTVAGNWVDSASLLGYASGIARGGVPSARIAVYKVCWANDVCDEEDILEAFHEAIVDGVDIISISVGSEDLTHRNYFSTVYDIGSFHAMKKGILTSQAVGNAGPEPSTLSSLSPWLLSVAASTTDRKFHTKVQLGNGMVCEGVSINTFDLKNKMFPIIYGGDAPNIVGGFDRNMSRFCIANSLNKHLVKGKIVLCEDGPSPNQIGFSFGVIGMIFGGKGSKDNPQIYHVPATVVSSFNFELIVSYSRSTSNSTATIFKSDEVKDSLAPYIVSFSSRGPNPITPNILKPDLAAPGVNILAAMSPKIPISRVKGDNRLEHYTVMSGTSMACPHATGVAAYVKTFHPDWSPARIKSALMTTAYAMSPTFNPEAEFAYGAGLINPVKATNPGLVYDISEADYVKFLCEEGIKTKNLRNLGQDDSSCSEKSKANKEAIYELNLPSFALYVNESSFSQKFKRTVTNVGLTNSTYKAKVISPSLLDIQVIPDTLHFTSVGQKKSFSVIIEGTINLEITSASLVWDNGTFQVRSPIVVFGTQAFPKTMRSKVGKTRKNNGKQKV